MTKRATKPKADFNLGLTRMIEPTGGPGAELATLEDAARFVGLLRPWRPDSEPGDRDGAGACTGARPRSTDGQTGGPRRGETMGRGKGEGSNMISLTLYGGGAFYANPDSIDYVRELSSLEHQQHPQTATCVISIGGKEFFVRGLAQNVAAEIQGENKTTGVEAQPADLPETGGTPEKKTGSRVAGETEKHSVVRRPRRS